MVTLYARDAGLELDGCRRWGSSGLTIRNLSKCANLPPLPTN